jgi:hypothetical protein
MEVNDEVLMAIALDRLAADVGLADFIDDEFPPAPPWFGEIWEEFRAASKSASERQATHRMRPPAKPRRQRRPSIGRMIAAAERGGKNVTSITTPDGMTLRFGESEPTEASNPWLADLKVIKQ